MPREPNMLPEAVLGEPSANGRNAECNVAEAGLAFGACRLEAADERCDCWLER